jgi:hypothetical protein
VKEIWAAAGLPMEAILIFWFLNERWVKMGVKCSERQAKHRAFATRHQSRIPCLSGRQAFRAQIPIAIGTQSLPQRQCIVRQLMKMRSHQKRKKKPSLLAKKLERRSKKKKAIHIAAFGLLIKAH